MPTAAAAAADDAGSAGVTRKHLALAAVPVVIAIALRTYLVLRQPERLLGDARMYDSWARLLLDEGTFGHPALRSWRPPLLPGLLATIYAVTGRSILVAKLLMALVGGLNTALVIRLGTRLHSWRAGFLGGLLYSLIAFEFVHGARLYPEPLVALCLLLFVSSTLDVPSARRSVLQGVLLAAAIHLQPAFVTLALLWPLVIVWRREGERPLVTAVLLLATVAALSAPWALRNAAIHGRPVLVSTNGGFNLLKGNHPGVHHVPTVRSGTYLREVAAEFPPGLSEVERDAAYRERAVAWIRANPGTYARLCCERLWFWAVRGKLYDPNTKWPITYLYVPPLALAGLFELLRRKRPVLAIGAVFVTTAFPAVFVVCAGERYRTPWLPLACVLAGAGMVWLHGRVRGGRARDDAGRA